MGSKRIPISDAKHIATKNNCSHVIMFCRQKSNNSDLIYDHVVTYGESKAKCEEAADAGRRLRRFDGNAEDTIKVHKETIKMLENRINILEKKCLI